MTDADQVADFQIEGEGIDAEAVSQEIHSRSQARQAEAEARGLDYEAYASGRFPLPQDAVFSRELYEAVRQVEFGHGMVNVEMELTGSSLPVVGSLVQRLRAAVHELVLFYVARLEARQTRFNEQMARALTLLVRDLEAEMRDLQNRVGHLEESQQ